MKRTFWFAMLVMVSGALLPIAARAQAVPSAAPPAAPKYQVYAGFAYTSLNQVNLSRYGLMGGQLTLSRDWGKYFALRGSGDYYKKAAGTQAPGNPGNPSVYSALAGPEIHANIYGGVDGLFFGEMGMEHTGGEHMMPSSSFAGGLGGGLRVHLNQHWAAEVTGDHVWASFSLTNNTPQLANSTHRTGNSRATIGVAYRF